jgi:hypothetical protein
LSIRPYPSKLVKNLIDLLNIDTVNIFSLANRSATIRVSHNSNHYIEQ